MNKDSSLLLLGLNRLAASSFLGPPPANPVHPPSSTAPTSDTLGPINNLALQYSQSPVSQVNNPVVSQHPLWRISPSIHLCSSFLHFPVHCK
ncbi:hypothetical protein CHARACLAT_015386 [Characodon lateralis]|uniref:Uncharacterized protein n=1 Tax=Characodon lateralis TaxID=208331 RepID=A0ABU7EA34_9TELE|nr:hypothetical protein [Characodon lateralis]